MTNPVLTANSPVVGSIAWDAFTIQYNGQSYPIAAGSTASKFTWWLYNGGSGGPLQTGDTLPTLTPDDVLLFLNKNGTPVNALAASIVDGSLIATGSILGDAIAANTITGDRLLAGTITSNEIASGGIIADNIAAGAIVSNLIGADQVLATHIAAGAVQAAELDAAAVVAGKIAANAVTADTIAANAVTAAKLEAVLALVSRMVAGDPAAARVELNSNGFYAYDAAGVQTVAIDGATGSATWSGDVKVVGTDTNQTTATLTVDDTYGFARLFFDTLAAAKYQPAEVYYNPNNSTLYITSPMETSTDQSHGFVYLKPGSAQMGAADANNGATGGNVIADTSKALMEKLQVPTGGGNVIARGMAGVEDTQAYLQINDAAGNCVGYLQLHDDGTVILSATSSATMEFLTSTGAVNTEVKVTTDHAMLNALDGAGNLKAAVQALTDGSIQMKGTVKGVPVARSYTVSVDMAGASTQTFTCNFGETFVNPPDVVAMTNFNHHYCNAAGNATTTDAQLRVTADNGASTYTVTVTVIAVGVLA